MVIKSLRPQPADTAAARERRPPLRFACGVMLKGVGLEVVYANMLALVGFTVVLVGC